MTTETRKHFHDLLEGFDTAMLVTRTPDGQLRARPMALAGVEADSDVWFVTAGDSGKIAEIAADPHVNVTLQSKSRFLSVSGKAHVLKDRTKLESLWKEAWRPWFPEGKDDPNIVLIRVDAEEGEFWDYAGTNKLKYYLKAGSAYLAGEQVEEDEALHQKTNL